MATCDSLWAAVPRVEPPECLRNWPLDLLRIPQVRCKAAWHILCPPGGPICITCVAITFIVTKKWKGEVALWRNEHSLVTRRKQQNSYTFRWCGRWNAPRSTKFDCLFITASACGCHLLQAVKKGSVSTCSTPSLRLETATAALAQHVEHIHLIPFLATMPRMYTISSENTSPISKRKVSVLSGARFIDICHSYSLTSALVTLYALTTTSALTGRYGSDLHDAVATPCTRVAPRKVAARWWDQDTQRYALGHLPGTGARHQHEGAHCCAQVSRNTPSNTSASCVQHKPVASFTTAAFGITNQKQGSLCASHLYIMATGSQVTCTTCMWTACKVNVESWPGLEGDVGNIYILVRGCVYTVLSRSLFASPASTQQRL